MKRGCVLLVLLALVAQACANFDADQNREDARSWFAKDGLTQQEFEADLASVLDEARWGRVDSRYIVWSGYRKQSQVTNGMRAKGYTLVPREKAEPWAVYPPSPAGEDPAAVGESP